MRVTIFYDDDSIWNFELIHEKGSIAAWEAPEGGVAQVYPDSGEPTLAQLYEWIGCSCVEHVRVPWVNFAHASPVVEKRSMFVDENGKLKKRPLNYLASLVLIGPPSMLRDGDFIVGTAVLYDRLAKGE